MSSPERVVNVEPVGGVMWCIEHHGIADECSDDGEVCDMACKTDEENDCDLRDLFIEATPS